jgi:prepilin-type N-terminal cleavage/methylation domain-containing protein
MKNGWTLIETLIVIAIIGIVAAIVIPQIAPSHNDTHCPACGKRY